MTPTFSRLTPFFEESAPCVTFANKQRQKPASIESLDHREHNAGKTARCNPTERRRCAIHSAAGVEIQVEAKKQPKKKTNARARRYAHFTVILLGQEKKFAF